MGGDYGGEATGGIGLVKNFTFPRLTSIFVIMYSRSIALLDTSHLELI